MKKIISTAIIFLVSIILLSSCTTVGRNAVIVDEGITFKTEWLDNNMTYGAYYENPDYDPEDEQSERTLVDRTSPESRTYVIKDEAALNEIFVACPEIDFEQEMLLVYCYTSIYPRERILESVALDGEVLTVEFDVKKAKSGVADTHMPGRKVLVIKMDRLNISQANIIYNGQ